MNLTLETVPIDRIEAGRNPRVDFGRLEPLIASIAELGLLQPPLVERLSATRYRLIAGERRWRAVKTLYERGKWPAEMPALVVPLGADVARVLAQSLAENTARAELRPWEAARTVADLARLGLNTSQTAIALGRQRAWVDRMKLIAARLTPEALALLRELSPEITTATRVERLCTLVDQHGDPDPEAQCALIRSGRWRPPDRSGKYDRTLMRNRTITRIAILRAQVLPRLPPDERRGAERVIEYLEQPGKVEPYKWTE
jgi:ParB/RepB/Spo0J family partition protein